MLGGLDSSFRTDEQIQKDYPQKRVYYLSSREEEKEEVGMKEKGWERLTEISNEEELLTPPKEMPHLVLLPGAELCRAMLVEAIRMGAGKKVMVVLLFVSEPDNLDDAAYLAKMINQQFELNKSWTIPPSQNLLATTTTTALQELYG